MRGEISHEAGRWGVAGEFSHTSTEGRIFATGPGAIGTAVE